VRQNTNTANARVAGAITITADIFSTLHVAQTRDEKAVCLSVCPSVKRVQCDKMEERSVQIFMPHKRSFSLDCW